MKASFSDPTEARIALALAHEPQFLPLRSLMQELESVDLDETLPAAEPRSVVGARADWTEEFSKAVKAVDQKMRGRVLMAILDIVVSPTTPRGDTVKALVSDRRGLWRYRIGDYRLIYQPQASGVRFLSLGHRSEIYD